jgi:hypothetical protein
MLSLINYNGHAEGRPINSIFYKLNLKDLEIHNKLPLEEHIYELEGVFAPISPDSLADIAATCNSGS